MGHTIYLIMLKHAKILLLVASIVPTIFAVTPTVLWHGLGDTCCSVASMGRIQRLIESNVPGVYIYSVCVHDPESRCQHTKDRMAGFIGDANKQVLDQCEIIRNDPNLAGGFNLLGFSQGGLLARSIVQLCPDLISRNLISIGGPQHGVFGFPGCDTFDDE